MPFSQDIKAKIFVRSARICCLCYKPCGTNIEAAHIKAEAAGGSNGEDNAIPLCFDCHQEIGAYDSRHPRGNRFTPAELKARRDQLYKLVESGTMQAQILAHRVQQNLRGERLADLSAAEVSQALPVSAEPSEDALSILHAAINGQTLESLPLKFGLLGDSDRAHVLDALLKKAHEKEALTPLMSLLASAQLGENQLIFLEQVLRKIALSGDVKGKAAFMTLAPLELLQRAEAGLKAAFFLDIIEIMRRDQFSEVNVVTPAVVRVQDAVPPDLLPSYLDALFSQAKSEAYQGRPAARAALKNLPEDAARIALSRLTRNTLWANFEDHVREFIARNRNLWEEHQAEMFEDFLSLDMIEFGRKYF